MLVLIPPHRASQRPLCALLDAYPRAMDDTITPRELARELGIDETTIRDFLRYPDDGRGPFEHERRYARWHLPPNEADRVRARFRRAARDGA